MARGLTTPSKPYIPKDDPSTPAVVISEAALQPPPQPSPDRARIAQTIPGQTRSNPVAAPRPLAAPPSAAAQLDDTYPPLGRRRSKLPLIVGAVALLGAAAFGVAKLSGGKTESPSAAGANPTVAPPPLPPAPEPAPESPAATVAAPPPEALPEQPAAPVKTAEAPPPKPSKVVLKKSASLAAPRKTTKAEPKSEPRASAAEPAVAKPKGVIVRETPF